ncbi:probable serine/threonine-protein kinase DDB_G0282963 isoform X2 [Uranotaenia lowii]|uniref:probable serine/threonine-protein kinase DDB_G0282963 isoform X2 n=1 Tax=Uranotaenia lowii TaxID=190385 RepID=UPI00247AA8C3|nr:probable serine/threonine-protein kinase DDB_G0282963 isoform X2 [Uranotaenia lowii]
MQFWNHIVVCQQSTVIQSQYLRSCQFSTIKLVESHLVSEDPESKKDEYAFDNPAFKTGEGPTAGAAASGTGKTASSPLDPSWTSSNPATKQNSLDKRKTVDDSFVNNATPRLVSLRGSDFTGLGVEVCGGLKEGIFVKKVMPQGPAAGFINSGDRITSITIDFRHIVHEDAATILSYASPYNVQLELVSGEKLPQTQSPKPGHQPLTHPLVRSSSQSDMNTIERTSRKKLFSGEDGNSTLKMEQQQPAANSPSNTLNKVLPTVHKENEKETKKHSFKQQMKEMIEEKFQTKHADVERKDSSASGEGGKKGHKFGIRVFPPSVNDKLFGKSPTKVQADNENNSNIEKKESEEKKEKSPSPPVVKKRTKEPKSIPDVIVVESAVNNEVNQMPTEFQRQNSLTSSGIKRDAAGIPQEMPGFMMQAANAARDNRKSSNTDADNKRKGKAPRPPQNEFDMDDSTVTMDTNLSMDVTDTASTTNGLMNGTFDSDIMETNEPKKPVALARMNFSDNFVEEVLNCTFDSVAGMEKFEEERPSNSSTPKSERKKSSRTESMMQEDHDSDTEQVPPGNKIELNSSDITVHQSSPSPTNTSEEDMTEDMEDSNRRTASLGDLSKLETQKSNPGSNSNTLERAQSLEITGDAVTVVGNGAVVVGATVVTAKKRKSSVEGQVDGDVKEPKLSGDGLSSLQRNRLKGASAWGNLEDAINSGELLNSSSESELKSSTEDMDKSEVIVVENGFGKNFNVEINTTVVNMFSENSFMNGLVNHSNVIKIEDEPKEIPNGENKVDIVTILEKVAPAVIVAEERKIEKENDREHVSLTNINMDYNGVYNDAEINMTNGDHVKITNYDTNIPDDVKVSRYPFGSLERPKSDVLKKLLGQKEELENTPSVFISSDNESNKITIGNNYHHDMGEPISLTLINSTDAHPVENEQTESSQASPVFSSNTNGISSINISALEVDLTTSLNSKPFTVAPKFSLDNIVTISTDSSQPSSIILIDDEKLDFSLQTLDDFDDSIDNTLSTELLTQESNKTVIETNPVVPENPKTPNSFVTEITLKSNESEVNGKPTEEPPKLTKKPPKPEKPTTPPSRIPVERRMSSEHSFIPRNTEIKFSTSAYDIGKSPEKRPLGIDQIRSNFERSNSKPDVRAFERSNSKTDVRPFERSNSKTDVRPVERSNSKSDVRPFERTNSKPDVRPFERSNSRPDVRPVERSNSKTETRPFERSQSKPDVRPFERSNSKTDVRPFERSNSKTDVRSALERSNSKTEIPVLIRRTSIPSINLNNSINSSPQGNVNGTNGISTNGSTSPPGTKASPSRIPVFNSSPKINNGHDSPRSPPSPFLNNNNKGAAINGNPKVSVSITSIKNQSKHPSGKFNGN